MQSIILYSRRAYSLAKHCLTCTWHEMPCEIMVPFPKDCYARIVDAELSGNLTHEFNELALTYAQLNAVSDIVHRSLRPRHGLSDYCIYFPDAHLGIILNDHRCRNAFSQNKVVAAASIEEMMDLFDDKPIDTNEN